ncbi:hypothetical protein ACE2AJ_03160 [Aquihabitans daechungensis]|uniref:hypothetical protein n=1 Tax=Aquihabitans daechungensis TaxID=1052257 RepID=UPI003BA37E71
MNRRRKPVDHVDGPSSATRTPSGRTDLVAVSLIAVVLCAAAVAYWFTSVVSEPTAAERTAHAGKLISSMYDPPENAVENAIDKGDGQLFAGQATDPLVRRPEMVRGDEAEQAYRYQRPAYGWLGWIASGGRPGAVAWALITVTVLSAGLLVFAGAQWFRDRATDPRWALTMLLLPGVFVDLTWIGPETLGTALVVLGLHRWLDVPHRSAPRERDLPASAAPDWAAVACFAAAGLCRETLLIVPLVLVVTSAVTGRWRRAIGAVLSAAPYVAWVLVLKWRIGSWPQGSVDGRLSLVPFGGLVDATGSWARAEYGFAVLLLGLAVAALALGRRSGLRAVIAANLALAATLGEPVWHRFPDFARVLLPLGALSLLVVIPALVARPVHADPADRPEPEGALLA